VHFKITCLDWLGLCVILGDRLKLSSTRQACSSYGCLHSLLTLIHPKLSSSVSCRAHEDVINASLLLTLSQIALARFLQHFFATSDRALSWPDHCYVCARDNNVDHPTSPLFMQLEFATRTNDKYHIYTTCWIAREARWRDTKLA